MASVLVTGGMGVIGSWVTRRLLERGHKVVVYQRRPDTALLKDIIGRIEVVAGDVLDWPSVIHTVRHYGVERIIHMAGLVAPPLEANPFASYPVNVDGAMNILEASRLMGIQRVVYISTKSVYAEIRGEYGPPAFRPIDEDYPKDPRTVYGATKLFMENMGYNYRRIYGLDIITLRFASVYGPGKQTRHSVQGMTGAHSHDTYSKIIESAMLGRPLKIAGGGDQVNDLAYHRDVAEGVVLACFVEKPEHHVFHLGTGQGDTLRHMAEAVNKIFGGKAIEVSPGLVTNPGETPCVFDISRARRELGYQPRYDFEAGVRDYVAVMKQFDIKPVVVG
ncbi:MAG: NAD-dependent epimerase/dehydratase family protein [Chloroflexota bacterium]